MTDHSIQAPRTVLLLVKTGTETERLEERLRSDGFLVIGETDPEKALRHAEGISFNLAIVADNLEAGSGVDFLSRLLRVSWTTSTILISNKDEETVHDQAEGLGILGHINSHEDWDTLDILLKKYYSISGVRR